MVAVLLGSLLADVPTVVAQRFDLDTIEFSDPVALNDTSVLRAAIAELTSAGRPVDS